MPPQNTGAERQKRYQVAKEFKGVNTKSHRTAIKEDEFSWLENMQPIGFGNLQSTPAAINVTLSGGGNVVWSNTVTGLTAFNINGIDYIAAFQANGGAEAFALQTQMKVTIAASGKFSSANVQASQWKDERALILDPAKGLFNWDGNNTITIGSIGEIAVTAPGSGFFQAPAVIISPPDDVNGKQATATATVSQNAGTIQSLSVTATGDGYKWVPNVAISAPQLPSGTQAVGTATILGNAVVALNLVSPGSGYESATVTITGGGAVNPATGAATINLGTLQSVTIDDPGTGYANVPAISIVGGGGSGAAAQASLISFATGTVTLLSQNGGQGYLNAGNITVAITGGNGTNAAAQAVIRGDQVSSFVMTNPGKNYTTPPLVSITGGGGSNATAIAVVTSDAATDVATFAGRAWVSQGRTLFFSAADTYNDFASVSAGNLLITDTTLHSNIKSLLAANNFLYVFGEDSINVESDVRVQSDGTTTFTNTNVSASVGTRYPQSVFPYYRTVMFQNDYGIFALVGATTTKLSENLDGIIPNIDFTKPVTAGQVVINNVLCACFSFTYTDPVAGPRPLQAVFFDKKWFFTSQLNTLKYVVNVPYQGQQRLYATDGIALFQLFSSTTAMVDTLTQSALWDLGDPIRDKQALKLGVEATLGTAQRLYVTVDSEAGSSQLYAPNSAPIIQVQWQNNSLNTVSWQNNGGATVTWQSGGVSTGYQLFKNDADWRGKYLGFTVTSNTGAMNLHTLELEHEFGARF